MKRKGLVLLLAAGLAMSQTSCKKERSAATGWKYNDAKWGGIERYDYAGQETGPGLVFVKGGQFTMGSSEQDVLYDYNNIETKVTVSSFYMDEAEVSNHNYLEYLLWMKRTFYDGQPEVFFSALPDTNCWREKLSYNEPFVTEYLRHPAFRDYPVVGVNWLQATDYAKWRTDRVNEMILIREGIMVPNFDAQVDENNFNSDAYLAGQYDGEDGKHMVKDIMDKKGTRRVKMEDGILLPPYRLPTEAEWEYAALAHIGNSELENTNYQNIYSWGGLTVRHHGGKEIDRGYINANFRRGDGDMAGIASRMNDGAIYTTEVKAYWPNDFGLYNMSGNVSEWTMDVYRTLSPEDKSDVNPYRGNVFMDPEKDQYGDLVDKDDRGRLVSKPVEDEDVQYRRNYQKSDNRGFLDEETYNNDEQMYVYGVSSLVDNQARVYKGGSWNDRAYWITPGTRRFLDENLSNSTIGFRCVMHRIGSM
ncbi:MAG: SUMF1/EgtB/PvdO family nonheme iron enzyme [Flavobacteriales bacterium]|nr:SUMF1/EgtB/PvdO family nonheme iron enzyme [Flavobacteriales bacterium]